MKSVALFVFCCSLAALAFAESPAYPSNPFFGYRPNNYNYNYNPNNNYYHQNPYKYQNYPHYYQHSRRPFVPILSQTNEIRPDGSFRYGYVSGDGQKVEETGYVRNYGVHGAEALTKQGSYSYVAPDGQQVSVQYTADENGFRAVGSHIPQQSAGHLTNIPKRRYPGDDYHYNNYNKPYNYQHYNNPYYRDY